MLAINIWPHEAAFNTTFISSRSPVNTLSHNINGGCIRSKNANRVVIT